MAKQYQIVCNEVNCQIPSQLELASWWQLDNWRAGSRAEIEVDFKNESDCAIKIWWRLLPTEKNPDEAQIQWQLAENLGWQISDLTQAHYYMVNEKLAESWRLGQALLGTLPGRENRVYRMTIYSLNDFADSLQGKRLDFSQEFYFEYLSCRPAESSVTAQEETDQVQIMLTAANQARQRLDQSEDVNKQNEVKLDCPQNEALSLVPGHESCFNSSSGSGLAWWPWWWLIILVSLLIGYLVGKSLRKPRKK